MRGGKKEKGEKMRNGGKKKGRERRREGGKEEMREGGKEEMREGGREGGRDLPSPPLPFSLLLPTIAHPNHFTVQFSRTGAKESYRFFSTHTFPVVFRTS